MMAEHTHLIWTLVLLLLSDVISSDWDVHVEPVLCAVKGSSIDIPCSFTYPVGQTVKNVAWAHHEAAFVKGPFVFESTSEPTSTKFQYLGDKLHNCSLRIYKVENRDAGDYAFRFWTDRDRWTGKPGVNLNVSDLKIIQSNGNKVITEGDNVKLTCIIGCKDHSHFQWYKNGHPIIEGPSLYWNNISSNNSGNYSCSIKTHPQATPGVVSINVEYGPKNTSVSAEPGLEVYRGSKVTLTCSSDANPPVETFTWFKITSDHLVKVAGNKSELVFWECPQDAEGRYFCCATNKHGSKNSSVVELTVTGFLVRDIVIISAAVVVVTVLLIGIAALTFSRKLKTLSCAAENEQNSPKDAVYVNWHVSDIGQSQERDKREQPVKEIIYATIDFNNKTKTNMQQQQTGSGTSDESVTYSTVCRIKMLNPHELEIQS